MLADIIKCINEGTILYDGENLSLPFFRLNNGNEELVFFTYYIEFNIDRKENSIVIGRGFVIKMDESLVLEEFELPNEISYIREKVFAGLPELVEDTQFDYNEMIALSDNMINSSYSTNSVKLYALAFEQYTSEYTKQIYMYIGEEYFNKLNEIVSI